MTEPMDNNHSPMPPEDSSTAQQEASPVTENVGIKETKEDMAENEETEEEPITEASTNSNTDHDIAMAALEEKDTKPAALSTKRDVEMISVEENASPNKETGEIVNEENHQDCKPVATTKLPPRPIKKARTAYFIFADEKRAEIVARHPGEGVGVVARETGQLWSSLSEEEKLPYHQQAAREKEQVAKALEQYKDLPDSAIQKTLPTKLPITALSLPSARIRKICKLDPDVKGMSKEALLLITKCSELFTSQLGMETVKVAALQNRRKLLPDDVAHVCSTREQFLFLQSDVKDLQQELVTKKTSETTTTSSTAATTTTNGKPLTDYFAKASSTN